MKRKIRTFSTDEVNGYNDLKRYHMQLQHMTAKQKAYWQRKPYDLGGEQCEESKKN